MAVELLYETHLTTLDNEAGIATGGLPGELSEAGRDQARELGERALPGHGGSVSTALIQRRAKPTRSGREPR